MPTLPMMRFDRFRLRRIREARGLSRRALAALCPSISESALRAYEDGRHKPDVDRALELARALGVTVEKLAALPTDEGARRARTTIAGAAAG